MFSLKKSIFSVLLFFCVAAKAQYVPLMSDADFEGRQISTSKLVGVIDGQHSITPSGAATYTIPINVTPGANGMEPDIAITYSSQSGNGILGMGWNLSGLSAITLENMNLYFDGKEEPIQVDKENRLSIDGKRLINDNQIECCVLSNTWRTETEDYVTIKGNGIINNCTSCSAWIPAWFEVKSKDGMVYEYGNNTSVTNSLVSATAGTNIYPMMWRMNKATDNNGNYIEYIYENVAGETRIKYIKYTGNGSTLPTNVITFNYTTRNDNNSAFYCSSNLINPLTNNALKFNSLLESVVITTDNGATQVKKYQFIYAFDGLYSILQEVKEIGDINSAELNSTIFKYGNPTDISNNSSTVTSNSTNAISTNGTTNGADNFSGDFDGDGFTDIFTAYYGIYTLYGNLTHKIYYNYKIFRKTPNTNAFQEVYTLNNYTIPPPSSAFGGTIFRIDVPIYKIGDYNGDGKSDILIDTYYYPVNNPFKLEKDNMKILYSLSTPTYTGFNSVSITNTDYLPYKNYCTTNYQSYIADRAYPPITGDFDGDGTTDIIHTLATGVTYSGGSYNPTCNCYNITSSGGQRKAFISFPSKGEYYKPLTDDGLYLIGGTYIDDSKDVTGTADFDGDSKDEIYIANRFSILSIIKNTTNQYQIIPKYIQMTTDPAYNFDRNKAIIGDFNGDGKADILKKNDNYPFYTYYSTGSGSSNNLNNGGFYAPLFPLNAATILTFTNATDYLNTKILAADFNGDGKCDVVFQNLDVANNKSVLDIYYSNGLGFTYAGKKEITNSTKYVTDLVGDFDGDGAFEILNKSKNTHSYNGSSYLLFDFGNQQKERLLKKVKDGFNRKIEFNYKSLTEGDYTFYDNGDGPQQIPTTIISGLKTSMHVVSSISLPDGIGNFYALNYSYGSSYYHREGKGFLGFSRITEKNTLTNIFTETSNVPFLDPVNKIYTACLPYNIKQYQFGGLQISDKTLTNSFELLGNKRIKIVTNQIDSKDYINGSNSLTTIQYDGYSNPTQISTSINGGQQTTTTTMPAADYVPVLAGLPPSLPKNISTNITRNGNQFTQATNISYDAKGRPITVIQNYQSATKPLTITYNYDAFGNVTNTNYTGSTVYFGGASTINVNAISPYNTTDGRFLQSYKILENKDISIVDIDKKWGTPISVKDNNNNKITGFTYDAFGRNKKVTPPTLENSTGFDIAMLYDFSNAFNNCMYKITTTVTGQSPSVEYYDAFNRLVRSEETIDGKLRFVENEYYANGDIKTVKTTDANGGTITTTNTYDNFHRLLTSSTTPLGIATSNLYQATTGIGLTINSSTTGQPPKITKYDGTGKITDVTESADGQTTTNTYTYHPSGNILTVSQGGIPLISCEYDENGNQTKLTDVDAGVNEYTYDAFGNVLTQVDARNNVFSNSYDVNGRLVIKIQALNGSSNMKLIGYQYKSFYSNGGGNLEHILYNDWDNATNNITEDYEYDIDDRIKQIKKNFEGVNYITKYDYGNYGRVTNITYPSVTNTPIKVNYVTITPDGLVTNINAQNNGGTPKTIYTISASNYNHFGQPKNFTIGGLLTGTRVYNELGLPTQIKTTQSIVTWQDINTTWNLATGNLTRRWELSPMQNATNRDESFSYDGFNRLTKVTNGTQQYEVAYDNIGRMNKKFDAGSEYKYKPDNQNTKLHALKTIKAGVGYTAPQPDDRTDISQLQQDITYNELNQPSLIIEGAGTALVKKTKFIYDIDGNRIKTTYTEENASGVIDATKTVHRYFLGDYEFERNAAGNVVRELSYINTPAGLAAIFYKEPTGSDYYLTCTDHLGSITNALASTNTLVNFKQSFDAWGRYRQPGNWQSYTVTDPPHPAMYRGFTGHEMLPKFDLINMNGRLYDPKVGQMLSPDNNVGDAFSTQHYNRYSYVWNNPLKYVDMDGELPTPVYTQTLYDQAQFFGGSANLFGQGNGWTTGTYDEGSISSSGAFSSQGNSSSGGGSNFANQLKSIGSSIIGGMIIQGIAQFANAMEQRINGTSDPLTKFQIQQIANNNTISINNNANRNATNGNGCSRSYSMLNNNSTKKEPLKSEIKGNKISWGINRNPLIYNDFKTHKNQKNTIDIWAHGNTGFLDAYIGEVLYTVRTPEDLNNMLLQQSQLWKNRTQTNDKISIVLHVCCAAKSTDLTMTSLAETFSKSKIFKNVYFYAPANYLIFLSNGKTFVRDNKWKVYLNGAVINTVDNP